MDFDGPGFWTSLFQVVAPLFAATLLALPALKLAGGAYLIAGSTQISMPNT